MSLSQKLALFQEEVKSEQNQEDLKDIDQLPMSTLKAMTIKFGKAKLGQSFEEAFQDQSWTKWFVATYENSKKTDHRAFLRYVSLRVEEGPTIPMNTKKKTDPCLRLSAQEPGKPSQAAPVETPMWDPEEHQLEEILGHQEQKDLQVCHLSEVACSLEHAEFDFDFDDRQPQEYSRMCSQYLTKFREEFQYIANVIKPHPQRAFLFEIMCSKNSELTRQGAKQGLQVKRFGLEEGDLRTTP